MNETKVLCVSGGSPVKELAGSIIKSYENGSTDIELRAIGASSVNQACKAIATARGHFALKCKDLTTKIGFGDTEIKGETKTVMIFRLVIQ